MPSRKRRTSVSRSTANAVFYPFVVLTLLLWVLYRGLFHYPVWFDETLGKAIFFALPVWLYITSTNSRDITESFASYKFQPGLLAGVALGGTYGFAASLLSVILHKSQVVAVLLFASPEFWWEFFLALMTGFWESLFFFSFVMTGVMEKHKNWSLLQQVFWTATIFLIFHLPNTILRFPGFAAIVSQVILLFAFACGQAFIFTRTRNLYTLVISHAIWGMVLLIHI